MPQAPGIRQLSFHCASSQTEPFQEVFTTTGSRGRPEQQVRVEGKAQGRRQGDLGRSPCDS